jgi:hypothetical protein
MITGALLTLSQLFGRYIHGQRVAFAGRGRSGTDVVVFDFSLAAVLSAKGCIPAPSVPSWELSSSTLIDSSHECPFFADDFSTYLPYVHTTRDIKLKWSDILFCADGLVCMKDVQVRSKRTQTPSVLAEAGLLESIYFNFHGARFSAPSTKLC